jgi:CubicO group peptidase (beta-lactamase class C family)
MRKPFFALIAIIPSVAVAQEPSLAARVDKIFARFDRNAPGCAVGLAKDSHTLLTQGYGSANLEYRIPLTDSSVMESGSVAKQFTAAALVLLEQDGKLSIDDDIHKYLPEVPNFGAPITIRNILTHTSGLRDQWGLLGIEGRGPGSQVHSPATTLDLVVHQKMLNFPPGSEYLYSNTGYALAGIIAQRVSGKSLNDFLQERLFQPLGMTHTQLRDDFTRVVPNRATAYAPVNGGWRQDMPFTNMIGNGGVLSTMADLMIWNENLDHPRVGGPRFTDAMQTRMRLTNGKTITYALGLEVVDYDGVHEVGHSGSTAGYRTFLALSRPARVGGRVVQQRERESHATRASDGGSRAHEAATRRAGWCTLAACQRAVGGAVRKSAHRSDAARVRARQPTWCELQPKRGQAPAHARSSECGYHCVRRSAAAERRADGRLRRPLHERRARRGHYHRFSRREALSPATAGG